MSDRPELLPCPFCGSEAKFESVPMDSENGNSGGEYVECGKCQCCTRLFFPLMADVKEELAEIWNRRSNEHLLETIRQYDHVIQAVATALGGVCCGGIDVDGPGSTKAVLVGAITELKREVAGMSDLAFTRLETLNKRTDELHLLRERCEQRGLYLQDAEARIRELTGGIVKALAAVELLAKQKELDYLSFMEGADHDEFIKAEFAAGAMGHFAKKIHRMIEEQK